mmetsp:Transcript_49168/g.141342  ORF Transcript_49168/g.141342 Transcript_49168/m.141342 type:complete len:465 (-) Transcript_49168:79-1473(-)
MAHFGLVAGRFSLGPKIGAGSFGVIYLGTDHWARREVAIKVELATASKKCLAHEAEIYRQLQNSAVAPRLFWDGKAFDGTRLMVTELLGPSLEDLFAHCKRRFSLKTTLALADQMLMCLEVVHAAGLIHRDLKPDNFLIGLGNKAHHVHLGDFGLAIEYHNGKSHHRQREVPGFHGSFRYASLDAHRCKSQSRRSDLEALAYMFVFMLKGTLPWSGVMAKDWRVKNAQILELKSAVSRETLGNNIPDELWTFFSSVRELTFQERPDYAFYLEAFAEARERIALLEGKLVEDHDLPWMDPQVPSESLEPLAIRRDVEQPEEKARWLPKYLRRLPGSPHHHHHVHFHLSSGARRPPSQEPPNWSSESLLERSPSADSTSGVFSRHSRQHRTLDLIRRMADKRGEDSPTSRHHHHRRLRERVAAFCGDGSKVTEPTISTMQTPGDSPSTWSGVGVVGHASTLMHTAG